VLVWLASPEGVNGELQSGIGFRVYPPK